ncbi:hypothetical protein [Planctobacterium marinum]
MKKHSLLMIVALFSSGLAIGQQQNSGKEDYGERIEVRGKKTPMYFYSAMQQAEIDLYDQVNKQLKDDRYKVSCQRESQIGTNLKQKRCLPNFVRARMAFETQKARESGGPPLTLEQVEALVGKERQEAMNAVAKVIERNPELLELLVKYQSSVAAWEKSKAEEVAARN